MSKPGMCCCSSRKVCSIISYFASFPQLIGKMLDWTQFGTFLQVTCLNLYYIVFTFMWVVFSEARWLFACVSGRSELLSHTALVVNSVIHQVLAWKAFLKEQKLVDCKYPISREQIDCPVISTTDVWVSINAFETIFLALLQVPWVNFSERCTLTFVLIYKSQLELISSCFHVWKNTLRGNLSKCVSYHIQWIEDFVSEKSSVF